MPDTLQAIADLEQRYDGPIPSALLAHACLGSAHACRLLAATGQVAFYTQMARSQAKAIRARRLDSSFYPELLDDMRLYLRERRHWLGVRARLAREAA